MTMTQIATVTVALCAGGAKSGARRDALLALLFSEDMDADGMRGGGMRLVRSFSTRGDRDRFGRGGADVQRGFWTNDVQRPPALVLGGTPRTRCAAVCTAPTPCVAARLPFRSGFLSSQQRWTSAANGKPRSNRRSGIWKVGSDRYPKQRIPEHGGRSAGPALAGLAPSGGASRTPRMRGRRTSLTDIARVVQRHGDEK